MERWICPYCTHAQIIGDDSKQYDYVQIELSGGLPAQSSYSTTAYACTNPKCKRISLSFSLSGFIYSGNSGRQKTYLAKQIIPLSRSKPQPDYIPQTLREDYEEACAIRDLSPKASATLVRRCLQGMIRDFCLIKNKRTLNDEIRALKALVDDGRAPSGVTDESVEAIDQVRGIGNIGAHMEKDINLIVEVDANEAQVLIELVEMLFLEWYVARYERQQRLGRIKQIAVAKDEAKKPQASMTPEGARSEATQASDDAG